MHVVGQRGRLTVSKRFGSARGEKLPLRRDAANACRPKRPSFRTHRPRRTVFEALTFPPPLGHALALSSSGMDPLTAIAASGMRARMESLDMLANNIANASTGGYKADREFYSLYASAEAAAEDSPPVMPVVERPWVDQSQGVVHVTGNPLDVALSGKGFFAVNGQGGALYTRNGSFHLSAGGKVVTAEGYEVRGSDGAALTLDPSRAVDISQDGTVSQDGAAAGQLALVDFKDDHALTKQGASYFRSDAAGSAVAQGVSVEQGKLEDSNTGPAEAAVRLVAVMRQFEMLEKAAGLAGEMNRQAIETVAKVGSSF